MQENERNRNYEKHFCKRHKFLSKIHVKYFHEKMDIFGTTMMYIHNVGIPKSDGCLEVVFKEFRD